MSQEKYPEYSACALPHYIASEIDKQEIFLKTEKDYAKDGIKTIFGQKVTSIEPENRKVFFDSSSLTYDKLVLPTGSNPVVLPIPGSKINGVFPLKSLDDADRILRHMGNTAVIIGSGPVGIETAIALKKRGLQVYLLEVFDRIMPKLFDKVPSARLRELLEENGITVLTGEQVTSIAGNGKVEGINTDKRQIACDLVIMGTGMIPNVELAKQSGFDIGALGGISVNERMMTNLEDIYACGDCIESVDRTTGEKTLSLLWHNAVRQGEVVGLNCAGVSRSYPGSENVTSLVVFDIHATSFGYTEAEASRNGDVEVIEKSATKDYYRLITANGKLVGAQSIGDSQDMGALRCSMLRCDDLNDIKQAFD
ncbi:NAD(P)/FAD-dependent oxidoreductase [Chloroflexota bacterium]